MGENTAVQAVDGARVAVDNSVKVLNQGLTMITATVAQTGLGKEDDIRSEAKVADTSPSRTKFKNIASKFSANSPSAPSGSSGNSFNRSNLFKTTNKSVTNESNENSGLEIPSTNTASATVAQKTSTGKTVDDKNKAKVREGRYKIGTNDIHPKPYIYVPSAYLISPSFNAVDLFKTLDLNTPNIIMTLPEIYDCIDWNMKVPNNRWARLVTSQVKTSTSGDDEDKRNNEANQFRYILKENCKRLVSSTSVACEQAGAVFRVSPSYRASTTMKSNFEYAADWICAKETKATFLALAETSNFHPSIVAQFDKFAKADYDSLVNEGVTVDEFVIDPNEFQDLQEADAITYPNPYATHLILCDDLELLEKKLNSFIPWGLM